MDWAENPIKFNIFSKTAQILLSSEPSDTSYANFYCIFLAILSIYLKHNFPST